MIVSDGITSVSDGSSAPCAACVPGGVALAEFEKRGSSMKELIQQLVNKADLSEAQATKVAEVVRDFIGEKLPEPIRGPALAALTGQNVDGAADAIKGVVGKLFG